MLSRQFTRHLMIASDVDLAAEARLTVDPEARAALMATIYDRRDQHDAIDHYLQEPNP
ncbi:hypothetical protein [Rhodococcus phage REQ1]|uniref:hypothetical protein n=1 Tax=Rhodococcus phage REQ1 TaxID=1109712 RepID=UPI00023EEBF0|nr:hypothetical protein RoPhREQ1_gp15 [Rhodococcus phage REQ1]AEV52011.1 hypothetical protein [Rhodococcus phage REQ1]